MTETKKQIRTLVIGAGLSGLMIAHKLSLSRAVTVYDKARGVGGRMATRRTDAAKFDHGAQFYRLREPLADLHKRWSERNLVRRWFIDDNIEHYCALEGMTALAKDLAQGLSLVLNERVSNVRREGQGWLVTLESGSSENFDEVIFTCPAPQSVEILRASEIPVPTNLSAITYTKALVVLIENSPSPFQFKDYGYLEPQGSILFSIADQKEKGISKTDALTVTLSAAYSETAFDLDERTVLQITVSELQKLSPGFQPGEMQLKKWRYCQVQNASPTLFLRVADGLYLGGDGFGGASLNGAARSAHALATELLG